MAKRKTKKEKIKRAERIERMTYELPTVTPRIQRTVDYGYDPSLVLVDIRKTILVSVIILGLELLAYFQLR